MKKITLLMLGFMLWFGFSVNAANLYLVANNGTQWTSTPTGFTNVYKVNLSTCNAGGAASLNEFLTDRTLATPTYSVTVVTGSGNPKLATGDQIWVAGGTYNVSTPYVYNATLNIYGGFAGTETVTTSRAKGSNTWNFSNETIINGSTYTSGTAAIFTATGDRTGAIVDGMTFTACPTVPAVWIRAAIIRYCKFTSNTFTALSLTTASAVTATCTDCYFSGNSAPVSSSNAACINANQTGGTATVTNCVFENNSNANTTTGATAGVKVLGTGTTSISNCIFRNNNATAGYSSAVSLNVAGGSISNCLIYGNTGLPAIYMLGGTVYNSTVVNNTAGGANLAQTTSSPTCNIYNSVFWGTDASSGTVSVANASTAGDFKYNATSSSTPIGTGLTISGNIILPQNNTTGINAPNFSNPTSNDWSLTSASSLIDIGNGSISGVPTADYVNVSRPMGGAYDIGAYEYTLAQEKTSNGGFEAAVGTYTVAESTTNVLMRVATTWDATTATAAPTATATSVTNGLWVKKAANAAAIKGVVVTTDKHSGSSCLNLKIIGGGSSPTTLNVWTNALVQQKISLLNTVKYTVSFWAKIDATSPNQAGNADAVGVFITDNTMKTLLTSTITLTSNWTQYSVTFDIPAHIVANPTADFSTAYVGIGLSTTYTSSVINYSGMLLDDFSVSPTLGSTSVSSTSLTGFNYTYASGPSSEHTFTVAGSNLASNLLVAPAANYEVSTSSGTGFQSTAISLTPTAGVISNTIIYTRLKSGLNAGNYNNESINVGIIGVTNTPKTIACSGTVSPAPLTITGISVANKVYDGTNAASITGTAAYSGLVNGETPSMAGTPVANFADETIGNGKTVTVSGYAAPTSNYSITQPTGFSANIYPVTSTFSNNGTSNWSSATDWTYSPISSTNLVVSSGELIVDQDATVNSVTVSPGAKLTLSAGKTLTTGTVTLNSDATGTATFVDNGNSTVNAVVNQYLTAGRNWYISVPVTSVDSSAMSSATAIMCYSEPTASWVSPATATLSPLKGYISTTTKTTAAISFAGTLNTGNQSIVLTRTASVAKSGFNLLGNPYPSYLDWSLASAANPGVMSTIWYRTKTATAYTFDTYNAVGNMHTNNGLTTVSNLIPPMQAFWVRVNEGQPTATVTFTNAMRSHADVSGNKMKAPALLQTAQQVLRLQVSNGINSDETIVLFNSAATNSIDDFDSPKMTNNNAAIPELYTVSGNQQLVINGLNSITPNEEIPLGFTTGQSNVFTLKATELSNFDSGMQILLKDNLLNSEQLLAVGTDYSFTSDITSNTSRFTLIFKSPSLTTALNDVESLNEVFVNVDKDHRISIRYSGKAESTDCAEIYNSVGQQLYKQPLNSSVTLLGQQLKAGVYVVVINVHGERKVEKVTVN